MTGEELWLFSYGTLRLADVQQALFDRRLREEADALPGYRLDTIEIADQTVVGLSGSATHLIVRATGDAADRIEGAALAIIAADLPAADAYETDAYRRVEVTLASGRRAFVYVGETLQTSPARSSAASTAARLAADGGVIGRRRSAGKSGRSRLSAYLTGPGDASVNIAVCRSNSRS